MAWLHDESKAGPLLGMTEDALFPERTMPLDQEDVFVLFTDGIVDVPNQQGEPFGQKRLETVVRGVLDAPPPRIIESIVAAVSQHAGETIFPEDVCIVAVEAAALLERLGG